MKNTIIVLAAASCGLFLSCQSISTNGDLAAEKPIQHMVVKDVTSEAEAKSVMKSTTAQLKSKKKLDAVELHEIHIITYSLEKSVAYYVENSKGNKKAIAQDMATVVEEVHLNSENNRRSETKKALSKYFSLEKKFSKGS